MMLERYPKKCTCGVTIDNKKHINRTIAESIASTSTGKNLADKIEYYLNTIDELEKKEE